MLSKIKRRLLGCILLPAIWGFAAGGARADDTIGIVQKRGTLTCGIGATNVVFAVAGNDGVYQGLEVDECRAIAAAVLGDASKFKLAVLSPQSRLTALQSGEVDVLFASTTLTLGREANNGVEFASIYFYDGQSFMTKKSSGVQKATELNGASVCLPAGGTAEQNASDYFRTNGMKFTPVLIESVSELTGAFLAGRCDAIGGDSSALGSLHSKLGRNADDYIMLPGRVGSEPLASAVRKGDDRWLDVVRWTHNALVAAETLDVTAANIEQKLMSTDPALKRLLGTEGNLGEQMGLDKRWAYNAIRSVGNFGEMWERSVTPTGIPRGVNQLWTKGGLMYSPPIR